MKKTPDKDKEATRTVWIWKYALTKGIFSIEAHLVKASNTWYASTIGIAAGPGTLYSEWTNTREEAVVEAEKMRDRKLNSLAKTLQKLQALTWEEAP